MVDDLQGYNSIAGFFIGDTEPALSGEIFLGGSKKKKALQTGEFLLTAVRG
jgi:hypothetical protein